MLDGHRELCTVKQPNASITSIDFTVMKLSFSFFLFLLTWNVATAADLSPFYQASERLLSKYVEEGLVDYASLKTSGELAPIVKLIEQAEIDGLPPLERKAFLINAYNLLVIDQVVQHYPTSSVMDVTNFFDAKRVNVAGEQTSLNKLEKEILLKEFPDARLHFVLVCGAVDCPPIISKPYLPTTLESQLDRQTKLALNDKEFLKVAAGRLELSKLFDWYASDFGGDKKSVLSFINTFRDTPVDEASKVSYYDYDWSLNVVEVREAQLNLTHQSSSTVNRPVAASGASNAARYVVSSTIAKGTYETKLFNNLYSQDVSGERASFFTSTLSAIYGLTDRINVGFDARYRRVRYDNDGSASNFSVLASPGPNSQFRQGLTGIGPKVRIAPFGKLPNFSIQSTYLISTADDASGNQSNQRFIDFDGDTWITQVFNDFTIGSQFSVFAEIDFIIEDIGKEENGRINRTSTPVTGIFSYFPNAQTTIYGLGSFSPYYWQEDFDYFTQLGLGAKYQFTPKVELELLATQFSNPFIQDNNGSASTVNVGLRLNF